MRSGQLLFTTLAICLGLGFGLEATARAQDAGVPEPVADAPSLVAPRLLQFVPAQLPADLVIGEAGVDALIELTIDATGHVVEASVATPDPDSAPSAAIDERVLDAVLNAARQLTFEPARRNDEPIAARIQFLYRIDPTPAVEPQPDEAAPAPSEVEATSANSDASIEADAQPINAYQVTGRTEAPPREAVRRELTAAQVGRIAGTLGDTIRAVEVLPGVARPPLNNGVIIVRGASPADTQVLLEGTPVLFLYHLDGLTSFFNASLLERVDFYPGNFSARFGRAMGGIIDIDVRSPKRDRAHGILDINLINSSLMLETPIGERGGVAIAARRSYIDLFFDSVVPDDAFDVVAAPLYWDYQAIGEYRVTDHDRLRLQAFGSRDQMKLITNDPADDNPQIRGQLGFATEFHRVMTSWQHNYGGGARHEIMLGLGTLNIDAQIGTLVSQKIRAPTLFSRAEWHVPIGRQLTIDVGWDVVGYRGRVVYDGPRYANSDGEPTSDAPERTRLNSIETIARPATFAELTWLPHERLRVIPGLRVDYTSDADEVTVDPRLVTRWSVSDDTVLKAGAGRFSQPPELGSAFPALGNPALNSSSALHVTLGAEHKVGNDLQLGVEGYAKYLWDLPVNAAQGPSPINDGEGRIFGVELSARYQHGKAFGYLAYTLSRSERSLRGGAYHLYDYDQPHILNVSGGYDLGRGWDLSGTFRLVSGNPETPVVGAVYDANQDDYLPLYGGINSARAATYHRLDVRIEKRWDIHEYFKLSLYLNVINTYNAQHVEASEYGFDYRERSGVTGLPLLPVIGVRGEM